MPRSIFTKMEIILQECQRRSGSSVDQVVDGIHDRKLDAFRVFRRQGDRIVSDFCQPDTIKHSLYLLRDLGLIKSDGNCIVTPDGRRALRNYRGTLGQAVVNYLHTKHGLDFNELKAAISRIKRRAAENVPSPRDIYRELEARGSFSESVGEERFVTLLNLLARCGLIDAIFRKYYWAG